MTENRYQYQTEFINDFFSRYKEIKEFDGILPIEEIVKIIGILLNSDRLLIAKIRYDDNNEKYIVDKIPFHCFIPSSGEISEPPSDFPDELSFFEIPGYYSKPKRLLLSDKIEIKYDKLFNIIIDNKLQYYCLFIYWDSDYHRYDEVEIFNTELCRLIAELCELFLKNNFLYFEKIWHEEKDHENLQDLLALIDRFQHILPGQVCCYKILELINLSLKEAIEHRNYKEIEYLREVVEKYKNNRDQEVRLALLRAWKWLELLVEVEGDLLEPGMLTELTDYFKTKDVEYDREQVIENEAISEYLHVMNK